MDSNGEPKRTFVTTNKAALLAACIAHSHQHHVSSALDPKTANFEERSKHRDSELTEPPSPNVPDLIVSCLDLAYQWHTRRFEAWRNTL